MSASANASRRSFLKGGAIAAAPLAAALPATALADSEHKARAQRLQDEAEIRTLHAAWLRKLSTGADASGLFADPKAARLDESFRSVVADHSGEELIELAGDGLRASGRFPILVELETELPRTGTLAQMAHLQGGGRVLTTEPRTLHASYVKQKGTWAISKLELRRT